MKIKGPLKYGSYMSINVYEYIKNVLITIWSYVFIEIIKYSLKKRGNHPDSHTSMGYSNNIEMAEVTGY